MGMSNQMTLVIKKLVVVADVICAVAYSQLAVTIIYNNTNNKLTMPHYKYSIE